MDTHCYRDPSTADYFSQFINSLDDRDLRAEIEQLRYSRKRAGPSDHSTVSLSKIRLNSSPDDTVDIQQIEHQRCSRKRSGPSGHFNDFISKRPAIRSNSPLDNVRDPQKIRQMHLHRGSKRAAGRPGLYDNRDIRSYVDQKYRKRSMKTNFSADKLVRRDKNYRNPLQQRIKRDNYVNAKSITNDDKLKKGWSESLSRMEWSPSVDPEGKFLDDFFSQRQAQMTFLDNYLLNVVDHSKQPTLDALQKNKVKGCFCSKMEYLQIHLNLLMKDFLYPLQCALHGRKQFNEVCHGRHLKKQFNEVQCSSIVLVAKDVSNFALVHKIKLSSSLPKLALSEQFIFGSLVCLSEDNFQSIVFGIIKEKDPRHGIIKIELLERHRHPGSLILEKNSEYQMIESPAYYEAYSLVLARLDQLQKDPEGLPFEKYLVECNTEVSSPTYLQHMRLALDDRIEHGEIDSFEFELGSLDQSQRSALRLALHNELALIQGPPGTGKTFIGVKLVELLLENQNWETDSNLHRPIVVLSYTNHALDQFLECILERSKNTGNQLDMVRVGSRCKSDVLKDFTLKEKLYKVQSYHTRRERSDLKKSYHQVRAKYDALSELLDHCRYSQLNEDVYFSFLHPNELNRAVYGDLDHVRTYDLDWLLDWFEIQTNRMTAKRGRKNISGSNEEDQNCAYAVIGMAKNGRKDLRDFFMYLARIPSQKHPVFSIVTRRQKVELFKYCLSQRYVELKDTLAKLLTSKNFANQNEEELELKILKRADIIGLTTSGASKINRTLTKVGCKIFIVEEAAEILESHVIAALTRDTQHLIMIGDHKQLRPKTTSYAIGKKYGLEISLFERLINNNFPYATLTNQHRMRPEISRLIHPHIYPELNNDQSVKEYLNVEGITRNVFLISHHEQEQMTKDLRNPSNDHEASFLASLCYYLLQQGYSEEKITLLTPYNRQKDNLEYHLGLLRIHGAKIYTIDHYQGEENDIILLSLVRSSKPGFVKDDNRICVALSRARIGFYCIGNFDLFVKHSTLWENVIESMKKEYAVGNYLPLICKSHGEISLVLSAEELKLKHSEGGCLNLCNAELDCGHICSKKCHPYDPEIGHPNNCDKPCARKCQAGIHQCKEKCSEQCQCKELVDKVLSCGHTQPVCCDEDPDVQACNKPCKVILECGHPCKKLCGESCTDECQYLISEELPCGHKAQRLCSQSVFECMNSCEAKCGVELDCKHTCMGTCGKCNQGRLHVPCKKHRGEICDRPYCNEPCKKKLSCGHPCIGLCNEICPKVCRVCKPDHKDFEVFWESEDKKNVRFIQLKDCGHLIEYNVLDQYMEQNGDDAIGFKTCPKCSTVISNPPLRYCNSIEKLKQDMKSHSNTFSSEQRQQILQEILQMNKKTSYLKKGFETEILYSCDDAVLHKYHTSLNALSVNCRRSNDAMNREELAVKEHHSEMTELRREYQRVKKQVVSLHAFVKSSLCKSLPCLPLQVFNDIQCERQRLTVLLKCYELLADIIRHKITLSNKEKKVINFLRVKVNPSTFKPSLYEDDLYEETIKWLESTQKKYGIGGIALSGKEEMEAIITAIGAKSGKLHKVHLYNIGQCSGTTEVRECGSAIGGTDHRLLDSNTHNGTVDESRHVDIIMNNFDLNN